MNTFDVAILEFFNQFARRSWSLDAIVNLFVGISLLKGTILVMLLWWFWFQPVENTTQNRQTVLSAFAAYIFSITLARSLAVILPFRLRPLHNPELNFVIPYELSSRVLETWSSFPSDHAAIFFALTTCLFFISKPAGWFAFCYTLVFICLPRVYSGLHYPSDIIGGAVIGTGIALLTNASFIKRPISSMAFDWLKKSPHVFYTGFFVLSYLAATNIDDVRKILLRLFQILS